MQLYALNQDGQIISAALAEKHLNYLCPECKSPVRLRGGFHRRDHFFHFQPSQKCRHSRKSLIHLQVQQYIIDHLPLGECVMERRFPTISRVADTVWESKKLIFEVQCSEIHGEEVLARNRDYASLGYQVVWLLHDRKYNKYKLTAAEHSLLDHPHYFTNIDETGKGCVYDQFTIYIQGMRKFRQKPCVLNIGSHYNITVKGTISGFPQKIYSRSRTWGLFFSGDLFDRFLNSPKEMDQYLRQAMIAEAEIFSKQTLVSFLKHKVYQYLVRPYLLLLQILLEKSCR